MSSKVYSYLFEKKTYFVEMSSVREFTAFTALCYPNEFLFDLLTSLKRFVCRENQCYSFAESLRGPHLMYIERPNLAVSRHYCHFMYL
jgi:hypothetical protein